MKGKKQKHVLNYKIILEPCEEGGYTVMAPSLPGCISEGDTYAEAIRNIMDAIRGYLSSCRKYGDPIPPSDIIQDIVKVAI